MTDQLFDQAKKILKKYWGFDDFRPGQDEVVKSVFAGNHTLVLFPTGGGKSLCFQVPALVLEGVTLVISPLVALMQDQVFQLHEKGIPATFINSTLHRNEVEQRLINTRNGMYKLLYCAPERLETTIWKNMVEDLQISMIAVDEAHCISEWGHDFRPVYRKIPDMMASIAERIRWIALTATATPEVRNDIVTCLKLKNPEIISRGFNRPNLQWWVLEEEQKRKRVKEVLARASGSGLIYAGTRAGCEQLSLFLKEGGWQCEPYHAGLTAEQREKIQNQWIDGSLPLVIATNAFGMGIDKPDCRYVIHYDMSMSIEAYYQEAGRAGRDGKESFPILLFRKADLKAAKKAIYDSWPDHNQLVAVYKAVCDHWNLASGSSMDEPHHLDIHQIKLRSGLSQRIVWAGLRVLDQIGILKLIRKEEPSIEIRFLLTNEQIDQRSDLRQKPQKREFIDKIQRLLGADVYHKKCYIDERLLRNKLFVSSKLLENGLKILQEEGILQFSINRNEPMGILSEARFQRFPHTGKEVLKHRDRLLKKLNYMIGYISTNGCRSRYIRIYFGEKKVAEYCGKCDNCKRTNENIITPEDLSTVTSLLREKPLPFDSLHKRTRWKKTHLKKVLSYMIREETVHLCEDENNCYTIPS